MTDYRQFYIDGQWVDPQQPQDCPVINPATEQRIATISLGGPADVDRAVVAARRAFEAYAHSTVAERSALIGRVLDAYRRRQDEIGAAISEEMGAPLAFARRSQAGIGAAHLATMLEVLQTFRFNEERDGMLLLREPVGVCGFITPWN
ncbi:MAG: aldehyde dehydrogenase family protein, partial [Gammaproteobacteria bacterium]|nr:aldehyde dehydrogenase family protein [Gammaproteobacteria bacterium]